MSKVDKAVAKAEKVIADATVQKADIAVADLYGSTGTGYDDLTDHATAGGYLAPSQADAFIRKLINQPTLLGEVRVVPMNSPKMEINKIGFGSRILKEAPAAGTALASSDRSKPTSERLFLTTDEIIAEVHIPYDVLEDNIERANFEETVMDLIAERASLDLEELIILGDDQSGDAYLALFDGILAATSSNVVAWGAAGHVPNKDLFKFALKAMPNPYLRLRGQMRHYVSPHCEIEYANSLSNRETGLGDAKVQSDYPGNLAFGVPVKSAALMPNGQSIFTYPKNWIFGVQRQMMIETDRDIRARSLIVVLTMRICQKWEEEDAVVKTTGINASGTTTT